MKILQVHNRYQYAGGEDSVVASERELLEAAGHTVLPFYRTNDDIPTSLGGGNLYRLLRVSWQTVWNHGVYREMRAVLREEQPDVVHCHNTFPLLSPSVYWACAAEKVPVVQTLHNYRLLCLNAFLFRAGGVCELCVRRSFKWPGIRYSCYRGSRAGSAVVAVMLWLHRLIGTWTRKVDLYLAVSEFQRAKLVEGGVPEDKIRVKPNCVPLSTLGVGAVKPPVDCPYALYVGRLSVEKGVDVLIRAWAQCLRGRTDPFSAQLHLVGDGPERMVLQSLARAEGVAESVRFWGRKPLQETEELMRDALFLVSPSICYETFGLVVLEAGQLGTPSLVSAPGAVAELVEDGVTGLTSSMGDVETLAGKIGWAFDHPERMQEMGRQAEERASAAHNAEKNGQALVEALKRRRKDEG